MAMRESHFLVVGAGVAGASAARALLDAGHAVTVVDRGRVPGGRASTRRSRSRAEDVFDHGAAYLEDAGKAFLLAMAAAGVNVVPWHARMSRVVEGLRQDPRVVPVHVVVPSTDALCVALLKGAQLLPSTEVTHLHRGEDGRWRARAGEQALEGAFDGVVVAVAAGQAARLQGLPSALQARAASTVSDPTMALLVSLDDDAGGLPVDVLDFQGHPVLARAVNEGAKPGRPPGHRWVVTSTRAWAREHMEQAPDAWKEALASAFAQVTGFSLRGAVMEVHRWGMAFPVVGEPVDSLLDAEFRVAMGGDAVAGSGVENAWRSGTAAANALLR